MATARERSLMRKYNLTQIQWQTMFELQGRACSICRQSLDPKKAHTDHDHATGKVRGILCRSCNHGLGNFQDNQNYLLNAINYLKRNKT